MSKRPVSVRLIVEVDGIGEPFVFGVITDVRRRRDPQAQQDLVNGRLLRLADEAMTLLWESRLKPLMPETQP